MRNSTPRFTRVLTAAVLAAGFVASAQARPTDPSWKPGLVAAATSTTSAPQRQLGAPFHGPRQTIPTLLSEVAPLQAALTNDAVRWGGPRNTIPLRK
ncbi:MAG: hypothetical protein Q7J29_08660 [Stagnimonas sp.]|nr:hypothetical protein [Stagnimonas sp.]